MRQKEDIKEAKPLSSHLFLFFLWLASMTGKGTDKGYQQMKTQRALSCQIKIQQTLQNRVNVMRTQAQI